MSNAVPGYAAAVSGLSMRDCRLIDCASPRVRPRPPHARSSPAHPLQPAACTLHSHATKSTARRRSLAAQDRVRRGLRLSSSRARRVARPQLQPPRISPAPAPRLQAARAAQQARPLDAVGAAVTGQEGRTRWTAARGGDRTTTALRS